MTCDDFSIRDYRFILYNHVSDGSLQYVIRTRSRELTVSTDSAECTHKGQTAAGVGWFCVSPFMCVSENAYFSLCH